MLFRLSHDHLADWCRRVGISLNAGLDVVRVLERESNQRAGGYSASQCWRKVHQSIADGSSLHEALDEQKEQLSDLFISMVRVGEKSGHLGETLLDLADYYSQLVDLRRNFLRSLILPIFELCIALLVVGLVILILGFLPGDMDILGLGLVGVSGLVKYLITLAIIGGVGFSIFWFLRNNAMQLRFVHYIVDYIPKIGPVFRTLALTRLTWALHLTMRTGMDVKEALALSFAAASYAPITGKLQTILNEIDAGGSLYDGFLNCRYFDEMMILQIQTGDESGMLPEVMGRLSKEYFQQCVFRLKTLSVLGFFLVFTIVAGIIIFFIFSIFSFYIAQINSAGQL